MMQISLPMYDLPGLEAVTDAWCAGLARALAKHGIDGVPAEPLRGVSVDTLWRSSELLLSQTCGYPLLTGYRECLSLLLTPVYRTPGCVGGSYRSFIVVHRDSCAASLEDLRGARCAINGVTSQSGMNVLRREVAPLVRDRRFFSEVVVSGRHLDSIALIAAGKADVAAIDCVTFGLAAKHAPHSVSAVRVLRETRAAPSLPYVTRSNAPEATRKRIKAALQDAMADPKLGEIREALLLDGFIELSLTDYAVMTEMEAEAAAMGYPELA